MRSVVVLASFLCLGTVVTAWSTPRTTSTTLFHIKSFTSDLGVRQRPCCGSLFPKKSRRLALTAFFQSAHHHQAPTTRRRNKKWIIRSTIFLLLAASAVFLSPRPAAASSTALQLLDPAAQAVATATTYASNTPPVIILPTIAAPVSFKTELRLTLRLLFAALIGGAVGKERSVSTHHSAGVRTMSLVAVGAASFTICSLYGFTSAYGGQRCDPSRMASNIVSGVGFVGAGVITTTTSQANAAAAGDSGTSIVHGLTTAAAIWLSAAVGVACGVGMYYLAVAAGCLTIGILRFGQATKSGVKPRRDHRRRRNNNNAVRDEQNVEQSEKQQSRRTLRAQPFDSQDFTSSDWEDYTTGSSSTTGPPLKEDRQDQIHIIRARQNNETDSMAP
jgi:putative Mg2+ transporter-C (MgtC) family protein